MCLRLSSIKRYQQAKIAKKDIIVWKPLIKILKRNGLYHSKYTGFLYQIGEEYKEVLGRPDTQDTSNLFIFIGFHSYQYKKDCLLAENGCRDNLFPYQLGKFIIPKGSIYYKGIYFCNDIAYPSFCSNRIKLISVVEG